MQSAAPSRLPNSPTPIPQRCTSKKPNLHIETQNLSPFPTYRLSPVPSPLQTPSYRRSKPRTAKEVENTTTPTSEREIVSPLDEAALSSLPSHLQENMREIQAERIQRLRAEQLEQRQHRRFLSVRRRQKRDVAGVDEVLGLRRKLVSKLRGVSEEGGKSQGLGRGRGAGRDRGRRPRSRPEEDIRHAEKLIWNPMKQELVPVYYRRVDVDMDDESASQANVGGLTGARAGAGAGHGNGARSNRHARLFGNELEDRNHKKTPFSQAGTVKSDRFSFSPSPVRRVRRASSPGEYMAWRASGPYYADGGQTNQNDEEGSERRSKWFSSLVSRTRTRVCSGIQRAKSVIIKK
ncbi:uncharacterized protein BDV14DRAFT_171768 [Aspergillus stella-maris]|uniref:uncharacterized protein n=1 Tax=Aspergillus stella-maris TaxID=1810926 RepID=UPI003CCC9D1E